MNTEHRQTPRNRPLEPPPDSPPASRERSRSPIILYFLTSQSPSFPRGPVVLPQLMEKRPLWRRRSDSPNRALNIFSLGSVTPFPVWSADDRKTWERFPRWASPPCHRVIRRHLAVRALARTRQTLAARCWKHQAARTHALTRNGTSLGRNERVHVGGRRPAHSAVPMLIDQCGTAGAEVEARADHPGVRIEIRSANFDI